MTNQKTELYKLVDEGEQGVSWGTVERAGVSLEDIQALVEAAEEFRRNADPLPPDGADLSISLSAALRPFEGI